jgi:hypothetical protein
MFKKKHGTFVGNFGVQLFGEMGDGCGTLK